LGPLLIFAIVEASNFKFGTQVGFLTSLPKTTIWTKIGGGLGQGSIRKKLGPPTYFFQLLKLATSNLVHKLGLGLAYQKQSLGPKLAGVWARGVSRKIWDPLLISATVEGSNFKFGTQLGFGTSLPKNQRFGPKLAGLLARGASEKKLGTPYVFVQPLKLAALNLVNNLCLGLPYQKTTFRTKIGGGLG